jgi:stage II sporulation protein M
MDNSADRYPDSSYRRWLLVAALLFGSGLVIGIFSPESVKALFSGEIAGLRNIASLYAPFRFSTFLFILFKNALSLLVSFILSPLLDIMPLVSLFANGWLIGFIATITTEKRGVLFLLLGILPHGIFELPAFFIGEAAALSFGAAVLLAIFKRERRAELPQNLKQNILRLVVALALLIPAAIIETYVTPLLVG